MPSRIINACKQDSIALLSKCDITKRDIWGRKAFYYAVLWSAHSCILWLHRQGQDLYEHNEVKGNQEDLIDTSLRTKKLETVQIVCELWRRPLILGRYLDAISRNKAEILHYFITRFGIRNIKGLERVICKRATVAHYSIIMNAQVCMSLLEALRYTLTYGKQKEFMYLMSYIRTGEQLNAIFTTGGHSTINLLAIATVTGNYRATEKLLKKGADPTVLINNSKHETMTTLHTVCNNRYKDEDISVITRIVRLLFSYMDKEHRNAEGIRPVEFAQERSNDQIVSLF